MAATQIQIEEQIVEGKRLGRHINHDPQSRRYAFVAKVPTFVTTLHERVIPILDQGNAGSCTGETIVGVLGTAPTFAGLPANHPTLDQPFALLIYEDAIAPSIYPPDDPGSDGLTVAKVAKNLGQISGFQHVFDFQSGLVAAMSFPLMTGVNWYEGFDSPDANGLVKISGQVRGGHEFEIVGLDAEAKTIRCANSWGTGYGDHGFFTLSWTDWERLLGEQGDATVLVPLSLPAPNPTPVPVPVPLPIPVPVPVPTPVPPVPTPVPGPTSALVSDMTFAAALHPWVNVHPWCSRKIQAKAKVWMADRGL